VNSGKVRLGYIHFAFLGQESQWAAEASECASDQGKFWEFHDLLFEKQSGENQGAFSKDNLKKFAAELSLDQTKFDECLDSGKYTSLVTAQTSFGQQLGVQSTPSFIVNDQPVIGAQPFETFQKLIEADLNQ
jgi:protein-disulfide isomerase